MKLSTLLLLPIFTNVTLCDDTILELTVGPRLKSESTPLEPKKNSSISGMEHLTTKFGYPLETYRVMSQEGYLITLHRIPYGRKQSTKKRPAVVLITGLFGSPECFLFRGPHIDLPYILSDAGFDMWFISNRGNFYSKEHVRLNAERDKEYWDFSFHELGVYDLPVGIDFILSKIKQENLFLIGYSMGTIVGQVMLAERPEYNAKIKLFINLAPTVYLVHDLMPVAKLVVNLLPSAADILTKSDILEIFPRRSSTRDLLTLLCQNGAATQPICIISMFLSVGFDYQQFDTDIYPEMFKYFPDGTSLQTILHYQQLFSTGAFKAYDYGIAKNKLVYNSNYPYYYNISHVTAPNAIYYGGGDYIVTKEDCDYLITKLRNVVGLYRVPLDTFNHVDFMWSKDVKKLLYDHMVNLLNKYR